jgi:hypothetical protein
MTSEPTEKKPYKDYNKKLNITGKKKWWTTFHDDAFDDYYFNPRGLSDYDKEAIFTDVLYPAFKVLAFKITENNDWHVPMRISKEDLHEELVRFANAQAPTWTAAGGAARSSYLNLIMNRHCYQTWRLAKNRTDKELIENLNDVDDASVTDTIAVSEYESTMSENSLIGDSEYVELCINWWRTNVDVVLKDCSPRSASIITKLLQTDLSKFGAQKDISYKPSSRYLNAISKICFGPDKSLKKKRERYLSQIRVAMNLWANLNQRLYKFYCEKNRMPKGSECILVKPR